MSYDELIESLVAAQTDILGNGAIEIAEGIQGLSVGSDGSVQGISGEGVTVADNLVAAYVDTLGDAARVTLQSVAKDYASELQLPQELQ